MNPPFPPVPFQVKCIDNGPMHGGPVCINLTCGKEYTVRRVINIVPAQFEVYGDNNANFSPFADRFDLVQQTITSGPTGSAKMTDDSIPEGALVSDTPIPAFPFHVTCIDNVGSEKYLETGKNYLVVRQVETYNINPKTGVAGPDFILEGIQSCFSTRRFKLASGQPAKASLKDNIPEWRVSQRHGLQAGQCACGTPKELCGYHKDT